MAKEVNEVRSEIPFLNTGVIYLDNAATTPTPEPVIQKMNEYFHKYNANIGRGLYEAGKKSSKKFEATREKIAELVGGKSEEIVYTKNTTEAINLIARGLNFERGDKIIASILDHHSNLVPWQQLQSKKGVDLEVIERAPDGIIDPSAVRAAIDENTKIVTMPWISNALGTRQPVKEIGKITKDEGVLFCIDAAQAAGNVPMNVKEIGCDFLVAPGHKGILGPQGTGFAYIKEEKVREIEPLLYGGGMVKSADSMTCKLVDPPQIFDAGTPNIPGIIGLGRAIEYIQEIGLEKIEEREKKLVRKMLSINEVDGVEVYGSKKAKERGGAISFNIKGINSHEVSSLLDELENIATRSGNHCAMPALQSLGLKESVRASVHYFNTEKETEKFAETIGTIASELAD